MINREYSKDSNPLHYAWIIVVTGMLVLFSCLGLGRFSLGMLLPSMGASLALSYSQMGLIGTGNFVGYMLSVLFAGFVAKRIGPRRTITLGLLLVGSSMMGISRAKTFFDVIMLYTITGIGSGFANIPMMGLVSHWFSRTNRGRAAGAMLSGNGIAIVLTGMFIPWINLTVGEEGWRAGWLTIGIISTLIAGVASCFLRNHPNEKNLDALGATEIGNKNTAQGTTLKRPPKWTMVHLGIIYLLFGATYAVYVTFIVTAMVNDKGFGEGTAGSFWAAVGVLSVFSGPLFGWISDKLGRKTGMMIVYALFTLSYTLAAATLPTMFLYASIGLFGISVWSIPTIMSAAVGDYAGPDKAVKALGFITLFFGAGQITGPAVAGIVADATGTFGMAFWMCAILTGIAVVVVAFLQPPSTH